MRRCLVVATLALALSCAASHSVARALKLKTQAVTRQSISGGAEGDTASLLGSSLTVDCVDWREVGSVLGVNIELWGVAGSSPSEWEMMHKRTESPRWTIIGLSAFDFNEHFLCDFRGEIVPISVTVRDLLHANGDWEFVKRVISQYPLAIARVLYPTLGRSDGVLSGVRDKVASLAQGSESNGPDSLVFGKTESMGTGERLSSWSSARIQRRLALLRSACGGRQEFGGIKGEALRRIIQRSQESGSVLVLMLPLSPLYREEMLSARDVEAYEAAVASILEACPEVRHVRLDRVNELNTNDVFYDFVHLNSFGKAIATSHLRKSLDQLRNGK